MTKILNGKNIADYMKERQFLITRQLKSQKITPTLAIIRNNDSPVINKYVNLKKRYGEDIGVRVLDIMLPSEDADTSESNQDYLAQISLAVEQANLDSSIHGIIVQLPLKNIEKSDLPNILNKINPSKDVDGLGVNSKFDSATATAIHWLLTSYNINLSDKNIAIVGRGQLVGAPLAKIFSSAGYNYTVFNRESNLQDLINYDAIITATGQPSLINSSMVKSGAVIIDAGTASEQGRIVGDVADEVRSRNDISAITPIIGGVGPLTIATLFEHLLATV